MQTRSRRRRKTPNRSKLESPLARLGLSPMLTRSELASYLHVSVRTIDRWILENRFPCGVRPGGGARRWRLEEVEAFLNEGVAGAR
jgi:excisionase family DNA binding protein